MLRNHSQDFKKLGASADARSFIKKKNSKEVNRRIRDEIIEGTTVFDKKISPPTTSPWRNRSTFNPEQPPPSPSPSSTTTNFSRDDFPPLPRTTSSKNPKSSIPAPQPPTAATSSTRQDSPLTKYSLPSGTVIEKITIRTGSSKQSSPGHSGDKKAETSSNPGEKQKILKEPEQKNIKIIHSPLYVYLEPDSIAGFHLSTHLEESSKPTRIFLVDLTDFTKVDLIQNMVKQSLNVLKLMNLIENPQSLNLFSLHQLTPCLFSPLQPAIPRIFTTADQRNQSNDILKAFGLQPVLHNPTYANNIASIWQDSYQKHGSGLSLIQPPPPPPPTAPAVTKKRKAPRKILPKPATEEKLIPISKLQSFLSNLPDAAKKPRTEKEPESPMITVQAIQNQNLYTTEASQAVMSFKVPDLFQLPPSSDTQQILPSFNQDFGRLPLQGDNERMEQHGLDNALGTGLGSTIDNSLNVGLGFDEQNLLPPPPQATFSGVYDETQMFPDPPNDNLHQLRSLAAKSNMLNPEAESFVPRSTNYGNLPTIDDELNSELFDQFDSLLEK